MLTAPTYCEIVEASENIRVRCMRTPLVRFNWNPSGADASSVDDVQIWLKLEMLQPIGSFKCRPAANALAVLLREGGGSALAILRESGVCTASAGNFGQGLAWCCREQGIRCTILAPDSTPSTKLEAMKRRGATEIITVPFSEWWTAIETHQCPQAPAGARFIHPGAENSVLAGNATIALEILEDLPDVDAIIAPYGSGALCTGIACGVRALEEKRRVASDRLQPRINVFAAEPATAAPFAASVAAGTAQRLREHEHSVSFVDGCGGIAVLNEVWELARHEIDGGFAVPLAAVAAAVRALALRNKIVAEGAAACPVAAAMRRRGALSGCKRIVAVVSGGGIDAQKLAHIISGGGVPLAGKMAARTRAASDDSYSAGVRRGAAVAAAVALGAWCLAAAYKQKNR